MAPHALAQSESPKPAPGSISGTSLSEYDNQAIVKNVRLNPFETTVDPFDLKKSSYTNGLSILNQAVFSLANQIFSFDTLGDDNLLDSHLQLWIKNYHRQNSLGITPFFHKSQVRSGAGNTLLGFLAGKTPEKPVNVMIDSNGLNYLYPNLLAHKDSKLPAALSVSAIDFDTDSNSLVSNYEKVLNISRALNLPVLTPTDLNSGAELQHLAVLNQYLSAVTGRPSVNLVDGLETARTFTKYTDLLSVEEVAGLYQDLLKHAPKSGDLSDLVTDGLSKLNTLTGCNYTPFEYAGSRTPETVFVVYGTHEATKFGEIIEKIGFLNVGVVKVRIPLPFNVHEFLGTVPDSTKKLVFLTGDNRYNTSFKADVSTGLFITGAYNKYDIQEFKYALDFQWTPVTITKILDQFVEDLDPSLVLAGPEEGIIGDFAATSAPSGSYLIWGKDHGDFLNTSNKLAFALSLDTTKAVSIRTKFDNVAGGGLFQSQLVCGASGSVDSADIVVVEDISIVSEYDILATIKPNGTLLVGNHKLWNQDDFVAKLSDEFKNTLAINSIKLVVVDFTIFNELTDLKDSTKGFSNEFLIQYGFWAAAATDDVSYCVNKLLQANGSGFELLASVLDKFIATVQEKQGLKPVTVPEEWKKLEIDTDQSSGAFFPKETSLNPNPRNEYEVVEETNHSGYLELAKKLTFKEAFETTTDLRPDLPVQNFVVKVQENIRLTPDEYSRNIFHIEFDVSNTGLTYSIGEALGIHGRNHPEDVEEFIEFYKLDGDSLIEISNKDDPRLLEIKTVRQSLTETLDFLGKPPKRFYEALAEFAADSKEKDTLNKLASSEGAADLKKRQEVDFSTYFDILEEFPSAKPPFQELVKIVSPLKRREYSIASSQRIHENAVHLLVVVVDWTDSKGRKRWGHCSKYLSELSIGDELVVSVKPSVMKLPPLSEQPIVMSGLGTGLAPFKAFVEEKIWQQQQGMTIGDIYLFMGSRHKKEEYLYGELWEAYKDAGVLTHIGAAFSRDQPQKIYIQDKIRESIEDLTDAMVTKNGSFYLCGPTWPVPDITACLEDVMRNGAKQRGEEIKDIGRVIEDMKEGGRYILEVY